MIKTKRFVGDSTLKEAEWKLVSELMKNSRRSDRELARVVGVSQPTVSRLIRKLEKEGYIREYTIIPDFNKLGYSLLSLTLVKLSKELKPQELEEARKTVMEDMKEAPQEIVCFERGIGHGCDGVIVSFHEDYSSYIRLKERIRDYPIGVL